MTDTNTDDTAETTDTADLQAEIDKWKALAQKHEQRAKANAEAAQELDKLKAAMPDASETDTVADRIAKLESDIEEERAKSLRLRIASDHKISGEDADLFLTAKDEETLTAQAKRLADHTANQKKQAAVVAGEGTNSTQTAGSEMKDFTEKLFAGKN